MKTIVLLLICTLLTLSFARADEPASSLLPPPKLAPVAIKNGFAFFSRVNGITMERSRPIDSATAGTIESLHNSGESVVNPTLIESCDGFCHSSSFRP